MPNWKRIIIGDAFKLPDWQNSVDIGLILPAIMSVVLILSSARWPIRQWDLHQLGLGLGCLALCLLLAREKAWILVGAFGYIAIRLPFALLKANSAIEVVGGLIGELLLIGTLLLVLPQMRLPRRDIGDEMTVSGLVIAIAVLCGFVHLVVHLT